MDMGWVVIDNGAVLPITRIRLRDRLLHFTATGLVPPGERWILNGRHSYALVDPAGGLVAVFTVRFGKEDVGPGRMLTVDLPVGLNGDQAVHGWRTAIADHLRQVEAAK